MKQWLDLTWRLIFCNIYKCKWRTRVQSSSLVCQLKVLIFTANWQKATTFKFWSTSSIIKNIHFFWKIKAKYLIGQAETSCYMWHRDSSAGVKYIGIFLLVQSLYYNVKKISYSFQSFITNKFVPQFLNSINISTIQVINYTRKTQENNLMFPERFSQSYMRRNIEISLILDSIKTLIKVLVY